MSAAPVAAAAVQYRSTSTGLLLSGPRGLHLAGMEVVGAGAASALPPSASPAPTARRSAESPSAGDASARPLLGDAKFKFSRLNLNINQHGEPDSTPGASVLRSPRDVSLFWLEKVGIVLFFLQVHALLWLQGYAFYPATWRRYWRWTLLFVLDAHNVARDSGAPNAASDSVVHTIVILLLPFLSLLAYRESARRWYGPTSPPARFTHLQFAHAWFLWAQALYLPVALLGARAWSCVEGDVSELFRDAECWGSGHVAIIVIVTALTLPFIIGFPLFLIRVIRPILVFSSPPTHELYVQSRELEYLLGLNELFEQTGFYTMSSYRRTWSWAPVISVGQKVLLVAFLVALSTNAAGVGVRVGQSVLFLLVTSLPAALAIIWRPYRSNSSNLLKAFLDAVIFFTCVMSVIESGTTGFSSGFIDPETFANMMLFVNAVGMGCGGIVLAYYALRLRRGITPPWPVQPSDLLALNEAHPDMLASLHTGRRMLEEALTVPEEFYPRQNLLDEVQSMRSLLARAKARRAGEGHSAARVSGSAAAAGSEHRVSSSRRPLHRQLSPSEATELARVVALGYAKSHALEWTLMDMIEDLALLYNTISARVGTQAGAGAGGAKATSGANGAAAADAELARFDRMQSAFAGFEEDLSSKDLERTLMHPLKRQLLARLLVVKGLATAGNPDFVYGERPPWTQPHLLPPLPLEEDEQAAAAAALASQQSLLHSQQGLHSVVDDFAPHEDEGLRMRINVAGPSDANALDD